MSVALFRAICRDTAAAMGVGLFIGIVLASLSAAGVVTMTLAFVLLAIGWLVGVIMFETVSDVTKHGLMSRVVFGSLLALFCCTIAYYEYINQPAPEDPIGHLVTGDIKGPFMQHGIFYISITQENRGKTDIYDMRRATSLSFIPTDRKEEIGVLFVKLESFGIQKETNTLDAGTSSYYSVHSLRDWTNQYAVAKAGLAKIFFLSTEYYRDKEIPKDKVFRKRTCYQVGFGSFFRCAGNDNNSTILMKTADLKYSDGSGEMIEIH